MELLFILGGTLIGIVLGTITGLIPGLHVNTVSLMLMGLIFFIDPLPLAAIIMAMAITHTLWNFVPSILLGAPDASTALSVLPGHQLLLEGRGAEAIYLTVAGGVGAVMISVCMLPLIVIGMPYVYGLIHPYMHFLLFIIAAIMIFSEKGHVKRGYAFTCFMLSGILGYMMFNMFTLSSRPPIVLPGGPNVFFPLFTGLFGLSTLIISLNKRVRIPAQVVYTHGIKKSIAVFGAIKSFFSGMVVGTLPGIGSAQAAVLAQQVTGKKDTDEFLVTVGGINTVVALFSLVSLYTISKARSGAAIAVDQVLGSFGPNELLLLVGVVLFATGISAILVLKSIGPAISFLKRFNYAMITMVIIIALIFGVGLLTEFRGILVLFTATAIGMLAPLLGVRRSNLMGVLMLPLILFYAGIV